MLNRIHSIKSTIKKDTWVKSFLKDNKPLLILVIILGFMTALSASALMFTSGYLISKASTRPYNILLIYVPIVLTRAFGISRPAFRYAQRLTSHNWVLKMTSKLRLRLYNTIEKSGIFYKEKFQTGNLLSVLTEDVGHIQNMYLRTIFPSLVALLAYIFIIIATGIISLPLGIAMFILFSILLFIGPIISITINGDRIVNKKKERTKLYEKITDNVLGVGDWNVSGQKERFFENIEKEEKNLAQLEKELRSYGRKRNLTLQVIFVFVAIAMLIFTGIYFKNFSNKNWIAAFVLCVFPLADTFIPLSDGMEEMASHEKSIKNINSLSDMVENRVYKTVEYSIEDAKTAISVKKLTFSYNQGLETRKILDDISFDIAKKQKICILGKSGAGKSTLMKILRGDLYDYNGEVKIFDKDMKNVDLGKEKIVGVLNQSPWIFNTTIFNNLRLGDDKLTYSKASEIIKMVGLEGKVNSLEKGMDTIIDEGGKNLSGGEKQRMALARILAMDTPIILLDEPTVGLDPVTEHELLDTIFKVFKDKTIVWVTHHLQDIEKMDRVLYLKDGKFIMDDAPSTLIKENEFFKMLYNIDKGL
ncbi:thiol reductant ABC exporter subunit CydC [Peptostreptococcus russellii]|uniref:ATP-binding cassette, subfamily C, CydC n=1 Tax=Peptostreptococcus russellii TaxID=215200 RepID=A0A1H8G1D4_9FIRM|nr:thiol reductant ABC exporter subunit CydC [Peptostreptococcus russellii]MBC2578133.1 thiol reductant ABC exporter subunit CydC [Peptostreptococcus russellii]SEN37584.1 ATP-binding cassette, subfamily C, CydC [Peptostreptococcus russellii]